MGQSLAVCCTTDNYETLQLRDSCSRRPSKLIQMPVPSNENRSSSSMSREELYCDDILSPIRTSSYGELPLQPNIHSMKFVPIFATGETWDDGIGESELGFERKRTSLRQLISEYDNEIKNYQAYLSE